MTALQDAQSIEARKARYSQELAAYTLRQWDLVRQGMEEGAKRNHSPNPPSRQERSGSAPRINPEMSAGRQAGVRAHDYARDARSHSNGGRAVAAGGV